jgi:hypothetical protein
MDRALCGRFIGCGFRIVGAIAVFGGARGDLRGHVRHGQWAFDHCPRHGPARFIRRRRLMGRIGGPYLVVQALAPVVLTFVANRTSDAIGLALVAGFAAIALLCFMLIRQPSYFEARDV